MYLIKCNFKIMVLKFQFRKPYNIQYNTRHNTISMLEDTFKITVHWVNKYL